MGLKNIDLPAPVEFNRRLAAALFLDVLKRE